MSVSQFRFYPSTHGVILLLLHTYLLVDPVLQENDLVAAALVTCFGIICVSALCGVLFCAFVTRGMIRITVTPVIIQNKNYFTSNEVSHLDVSAVFKLLPGLQANVILHSELPDAPYVECLYTDDKNTLSRAAVVFPHRGNWLIDGATIKISDRLGLWIATIEVSFDEQSVALEVQPPFYSGVQFPVVQSTEREGDASISSNHAQGDLYDIKRYHPSDGMRKIVWKVFARTGELLSRHPEPTMTPEGKTLIFAAGATHNDAAYSAAADYALHRESEGFEVLMNGATFGEDSICKSSEEFLKQSVASAFHPADASVLNVLLSNAGSEGGILKQVAIFVDLNQSVSESIALCMQAIQIVQNAGLAPVIMAVSDQPLRDRVTMNKNSSIAAERIKRLVTEQPPTSSQEEVNQIVSFIQYCEHHQWQVA